MSFAELFTEDEKRDVRTFIRRIIQSGFLDAVEVVRCKDCKHGDEENGTEWIGGHAPFYCGFHGGLFDGDCYCSFGERREDG